MIYPHTGPGDPHWHPTPEQRLRVEWIKRKIEVDSRGRYYWYDKATLRKLRSPYGFAALNRALAMHQAPAVLKQIHASMV